MGKIIPFAIAAAGSLFILGYAVHMFIGDIVARSTEMIAIAITVSIGAAVIAWMTWDVLRRR